jgi:hypothetical protein
MSLLQRLLMQQGLDGPQDSSTPLPGGRKVPAAFGGGAPFGAAALTAAAGNILPGGRPVPPAFGGDLAGDPLPSGKPVSPAFGGDLAEPGPMDSGVMPPPGVNGPPKSLDGMPPPASMPPPPGVNNGPKILSPSQGIRSFTPPPPGVNSGPKSLVPPGPMPEPGIGGGPMGLQMGTPYDQDQSNPIIQAILASMRNKG